jgi:hypothetical protein
MPVNEKPHEVSEETLRVKPFLSSLEPLIAFTASVAILVHLFLRFLAGASPNIAAISLYLVLVVGGLPILFDLARQLMRGHFRSRRRGDHGCFFAPSR